MWESLIVYKGFDALSESVLKINISSILDLQGFFCLQLLQFSFSPVNSWYKLCCSHSASNEYVNKMLDHFFCQTFIIRKCWPDYYHTYLIYLHLNKYHFHIIILLHKSSLKYRLKINSQIHIGFAKLRITECMQITYYIYPLCFITQECKCFRIRLAVVYQNRLLINTLIIWTFRILVFLEKLT